jgi:predicted HTH domain antitoxin
MSITLELPVDISESDARRELAIALYREGKLPPGRAAQLAGMDRWDFDALLFERKVPFPRSDESLLQEVREALRGDNSDILAPAEYRSKVHESF